MDEKNREGKTAKQILYQMRAELVEPVPFYEQVCNQIRICRKTLLSELPEEEARSQHG